MRLQATSPLLDGWQGEARITTDTAASPYGVPVLLIEGEPVGTFEAALAGYRILEATDNERAALARGGYTMEG